MNISHRLAAIVAAFLAVTSSAASLYAQGTGPATGTRPGTGTRPAAPNYAPAGGTMAPAAAPAAAAPSGAAPSVVVIDVGEVFKQHAQFNAQLNALKEEIKTLDGYAQSEQKKILQKREGLQTYSAGTPEYKRLEEEVARLASDLQVEMALKQKGVAEQEAMIYYNTYTQIYEEVKGFADRYGISLVLRHNNVKMEPQKRDTVLQGVNRNIVFQRNLDITDEIIKRVNSAQARRPAGPGAGSGATGPTGPAVPRGTTTR